MFAQQVRVSLVWFVNKVELRVTWVTLGGAFPRDVIVTYAEAVMPLVTLVGYVVALYIVKNCQVVLAGPVALTTHVDSQASFFLMLRQVTGFCEVV